MDEQFWDSYDDWVENDDSCDDYEEDYDDEDFDI